MNGNRKLGGFKMAYRKKARPVISAAGQRKDMVRKDTGAAITFDENLREEIEWRREHRQ